MEKEDMEEDIYVFKNDEGKVEPTKTWGKTDFKKRSERANKYPTPTQREEHAPLLHDFWRGILNSLPIDARTLGLFEALSHGAEKYDRYSWREVPNGAERYSDAFFRHYLWELYYPDSEGVDKDSGLPHIACAAACVAIVMDLLDVQA